MMKKVMSRFMYLVTEDAVVKLSTISILWLFTFVLYYFHSH